MSAADERVAELLERWRASVELHARYLSLDDASYAKVQDWPKHQRPTRWVVELARTRLLELKRIADDRRSGGDAAFAEALELMAFLTNLLGSEHVDRFIPLAQPQVATPEPTPDPAAAPPPAPQPTPKPAPKPARRSEPPRTESRPARPSATAARRPPAPSPKSAVATTAPAASDPLTATVIADAVRLVSWGREWPQLAGLIARLANRPPEAEVWKILRKHRADIEAQARRPRD